MLKVVGIENLHFHDLRHEAISRFFEMGLATPLFRNSHMCKIAYSYVQNFVCNKIKCG